MGYCLRTDARHVHASENIVNTFIQSALQTAPMPLTNSYFQFDKNKRTKHITLYSTFKL